MKIGLYGGTFDPIHFGHLILSEWIRQRFRLDKIIFIPAFIPPHKLNREISPSQIRKKMIRKAISGNPFFEVSDYEIKKQGISFSIETILFFRKQYQLSKKKLYFLIGSDSLIEFPQWHKPEMILDSCEVTVYRRPGYDVAEVDQQLLEKVRIVDNPLIEISASTIRTLVSQGKSVKYMLPFAVEKFILDNSLYKKIP